MTRGNERREHAPMSSAMRSLVIGGAVFLAAGLAAWMWLGDWRTAVTGVLVMLLTLVAAATLGDRT